MSTVRPMTSKRHLQERPQQIHGHFCSAEVRRDRHVRCKPDHSAFERPQWDDSTKVPRTFDEFWTTATQQKQRVFAYAKRKTGQCLQARAKTGSKGEATTSPSGLAALKFPDYFILFARVCFSPDCSDLDGHIQAFPKKKARMV
ncbi:uncharacterized protein [Dermacentor albipictus]|uniref:uncharacterized protein n=1 Tax=Dermacentor albipictus TaxID=60249 RepID=UPI0031FDD4E0